VKFSKSVYILLAIYRAGRKMGDLRAKLNSQFPKSPRSVDIRLHSFSNDSRQRELIIDKLRVVLNEKSLRRLTRILLQEYHQDKKTPLQVVDLLIPPRYKLANSSVPEVRSGWSAGRRYEYYEDEEDNQAFRIFGPRGLPSSFHRLGRIDDSQSRIGRFWAHFPNNRVRKKDLVDMFAYDYQLLKAMIDILVDHGRVKEVVVARTKKGDRIVAYERARNGNFSSSMP
jgi:hypothetical protein